MDQRERLSAQRTAWYRKVSLLSHAILALSLLMVATLALSYRRERAALTTNEMKAENDAKLRAELEHTRNERDLARVCAFALGSRLATLGRIYSGDEPFRSDEDFRSLLLNPNDRTVPPLLPECESIGSTIHHPPSAPPR